jgi:hypothetical protein
LYNISRIKDCTLYNNPPVNRRVVGSSPTWGAKKALENQVSEALLFADPEEKSERIGTGKGSK